MLCASFKIKIEFEGWVKIVDELKRLKRLKRWLKKRRKKKKKRECYVPHLK